MSIFSSRYVNDFYRFIGIVCERGSFRLILPRPAIKIPDQCRIDADVQV